MIRLYILAGILAVIVGLGGYAMLERAWRQAAVTQLAREADMRAMAEAERDAAREAARRYEALADQQAAAARRARADLDATTIAAQQLIADIQADEAANPPTCACRFTDDQRRRLQQDIPVRRPVPAPAAAR